MSGPGTISEAQPKDSDLEQLRCHHNLPLRDSSPCPKVPVRWRFAANSTASAGPVFTDKDRRSMSKSQVQPQTSILCVAPFNIPHIMPWYEQICVQPGVSATCAVVNSVPQVRLKMGWPELPTDSPHLQLWRRPGDRRAYYKALWTADVVIFPGFFHYQHLPFEHWLRRLTGKPTLLWSEPFFRDPRTSHSAVSLAARRLLLAPCNSPQVHLMTMGHGAEADYRALGCGNWTVWRFGYSIMPVAEPPDLSSNSPVKPVQLVFCGSLVDYKGVDVLLAALASENVRRLDWRLTLIGDGPERKNLADQARSAGIQERLTFRGSVPLDQCANDYRNSEVLVLPSRFDGWGAVVNEAMEFGLAVVVSDAVGAAATLVDEGVNGHTFRSGDTDQLAAHLSNLISDTELRRSMRQASRDRIVDFRPQEAARRATALCRGLAGHAPLPSFADGFCSRLV